MRQGNFIKKRKFKRLDLSIPMKLRHILSNGKEAIVDTFTNNVSYNGAFITEIDPKSIRPEDNLQISLSVPRDNARDFPFSRLIGKARVVRVNESGVALEFNEEMTRLFVTN